MYVTEYEHLIPSRSKVISKKRGVFFASKKTLRSCIQYVSLRSGNDMYNTFLMQTPYTILQKNTQ